MSERRRCVYTKDEVELLWIQGSIFVADGKLRLSWEEHTNLFNQIHRSDENVFPLQGKD
jgi:hypothetical protein